MNVAELGILLGTVQGDQAIIIISQVIEITIGDILEADQGAGTDIPEEEMNANEEADHMKEKEVEVVQEIALEEATRADETIFITHCFHEFPLIDGLITCIDGYKYLGGNFVLFGVDKLTIIGRINFNSEKD